MTRRAVRGYVVSALAALTLVASAAYAAPASYSGTLKPSTQITASGAWASTQTLFKWDVKELSGGWWQYDYLFSVPSKDISHMIIETSSNLTSNDLGTLKVNGVTLHPGAPGVLTTTSGNPGMPSNVFGIKAEGVPDSTSWAISFTARRAPVWGDFFAKGGNGGKTGPLYAYNAGFDGTVFNPTAYVTRNGLITDLKIAVPDSVPMPQPVVPEPSSLVLAVMGFVTSGGCILRRNRR